MTIDTVPLGLRCKLKKESVEEILAVQHKIANTGEWRNSQYGEIEELDDELIFYLKGFENKKNYNVRVLSTKESLSHDFVKQYLLFEATIEVSGKYWKI